MPIAMSYDRPAEEGALVTELSGIPKEKESLASLLAAAGSLAVGGSKRKPVGRKASGGGGEVLVVRPRVRDQTVQLRRAEAVPPIRRRPSRLGAIRGGAEGGGDSNRRARIVRAEIAGG